MIRTSHKVQLIQTGGTLKKGQGLLQPYRHACVLPAATRIGPPTFRRTVLALHGVFLGSHLLHAMVMAFFPSFLAQHQEVCCTKGDAIRPYLPEVERYHLQLPLALSNHLPTHPPTTFYLYFYCPEMQLIPGVVPREAGDCGEANHGDKLQDMGPWWSATAT